MADEFATADGVEYKIVCNWLPLPKQEVAGLFLVAAACCVDLHLHLSIDAIDALTAYEEMKDQYGNATLFRIEDSSLAASIEHLRASILPPSYSFALAV